MTRSALALSTENEEGREKPSFRCRQEPSFRATHCTRMYAMARTGEEDLSTLHRARPVTSTAPRSFSITVVQGPDQGQRFDLDPSQPCRALLGTSEACLIRLSDREVSRRHAALEFVGPHLHLTDLGSTNGTWMGGSRIVEAIIEEQASLKLGSSLLSVQSVTSSKKVKLSSATRYGRVIGGSMAMRRLYPLCERLAATSVPVLLEGETGTGKELMAESLHEQGPRASNPFVVVFDCSAVAPTLVESQLFGHERGAFTGAATARRGRVRARQGRHPLHRRDR